MNDDIINEALNIALQFGGTDGGHHKQWVIDQMVRILTECPMVEKRFPNNSGRPGTAGTFYTAQVLGESEAYLKWLKAYEGDPEDEENYYGEWDTGIAP
jgi:hypothetical protein